VMVVEQHEEALLVAHEERRRPVTQPLAHLRQREADGAEPLQHDLALRGSRVAHRRIVPRGATVAPKGG
jgi:hypothetical protein